MDFDDLTRSYFGQGPLDEMTPSALKTGVERMLVDLDLERDRARRFAIWSLLYMLEAAPDLNATFTDAADRDAARNFMDLVEVEEVDGESLEPPLRR